MMGRLLRGSAALVTLIALVAGLPVALFLLAGNPLPSHIPSWHEATSLLLFVQTLIGHGYDQDFSQLLLLQAKASGIELKPEKVQLSDGLS